MKKLTLSLFLLLFSNSLLANDVKNITQLLNEFLAKNHLAEQHQRFWAEDLIYTSSAGKRFGKKHIMASYAKTSPNKPPSARYFAEQINIRMFGDSALLTFKLVGKQPDKPTQYYLNTGMMVKRNGQWQAVGWQATKAE